MNDSLKKSLIIAAAAAAILLVSIAARAAYQFLYITLPPEQVTISVSYSPVASCRTDSPLYMLITNESYREINSTSFTLTVKKKIDKDNYIQLLEREYSTDRTIKAGESYAGCWAFPKLNTEHYVAEELIYEISGKHIVF